jgi:hypothetical protein
LKPLDDKPGSLTPWQRLRVWWWKWRYAERMLNQLGVRDEGALNAATHCANEGWIMALDDNKDDVEAALKECPKDSADSELSYWNEG